MFPTQRHESVSPSSREALTIGFLRRGYSPTGGTEVYLKGLARGLQAQGHRPILLGTEGWPAEAWPGGEIVRCEGTSFSTYAAAVAEQRRKRPMDLVISVEKIPGCDLYRTDEGVHAAWLAAREPHLSPWARWFQKISPKHREKLRLEKEVFNPASTRRVIAISERIIREITGTYGYPRERITLIRNGVAVSDPPDEAERSAARAALGIAPAERCILFVGTGWERKGLGFAIRAVKLLGDPRVKLLVAGRGKTARYASPRVNFLGAVRDMRQVYAAGDLLVAPAIYEPFSLAGLEALGAGLPVIAGKAVGLSEVMSSGIHGEVLEDPSEIGTFTLALRRWLDRLEDPDEASKIRGDCARLASEFTLERNLSETLAVIRDVLEEKQDGRGQRGS